MSDLPRWMLLVDPVDADWIGEDADGNPADARKVDAYNAALLQIAVLRYPNTEVRLVHKQHWAAYMASMSGTAADCRQVGLSDAERHELYLAAVDLVLR